MIFSSRAPFCYSAIPRYDPVAEFDTPLRTRWWISSPIITCASPVTHASVLRTQVPLFHENFGFQKANGPWFR